MIDFTSSSFTGLELDKVMSVQIMLSHGITSSINIDVLITLVPVTADG